MRTLLKLLVAAAMVLTGSFVSNAQPGGGFGGQMDPEQIAKFRADDMKQTVKLTDDQYKKVVDLYKAEMENMMKMFESGGMPDMRRRLRRPRPALAFPDPEKGDARWCTAFFRAGAGR